MTPYLSRLPWDRWKHKLLEVLPGYSSKAFVPDLIAGVTVGLVALPLAMAFGIASGVTLQAGIYTAILGGLVGVDPVACAELSYSFGAIPSAFIFRYKWLRSKPNNSAVRVTLPLASSSFFKI